MSGCLARQKTVIRVNRGIRDEVTDKTENSILNQIFIFYMYIPNIAHIRAYRIYWHLSS